MSVGRWTSPVYHGLRRLGPTQSPGRSQPQSERSLAQEPMLRPTRPESTWANCAPAKISNSRRCRLRLHECNTWRRNATEAGWRNILFSPADSFLYQMRRSICEHMCVTERERERQRIVYVRVHVCVCIHCHLLWRGVVQVWLVRLALFECTKCVRILSY